MIMTRRVLFAALLLALAALACSREAAPPVYTVTATPWAVESTPGIVPTAPLEPAGTGAELTLSAPTPDPTRPIEAQDDKTYVVQPGDTLLNIALVYDTTIPQLMALNGITNENSIFVGQVLEVPGEPAQSGPSFKIIPDSELIYGPSLLGFDAGAYIARQPGYLRTHVEEVDGQSLTGAQIVCRVGLELSVSPRLLLALLEYRSGWLTKAAPSELELAYPMGYANTLYVGLYRQLSWAANKLNEGYYGWRNRGLSVIVFPDGERIAFAPQINAGTAAVQHLFAQTHSLSTWLPQVGADGFYATFVTLFGNPFAYAVEPLIPPDVTQPELALPWAEDETWYLTGGPHGAWASGSAWAAVDFAPPGEQMGCYVAEAWTRAMAPGVIARSGEGAVLLDLDGDGYEGTGWVIFYLHLANRVPAGVMVDTGDPLGQPSCEGGVTTATHVHIARKYNGVWMPAQCPNCAPLVGAPPFVMGGWAVGGFLGQEYDGYMTRGEEYREAFDGGREEINAVCW
jgi:LasA protease